MTFWNIRHPIFSRYFRELHAPSSNQARLARWLHAAPATAWMAFLFYASSISSPAVPLRFNFGDKIMHFGAYLFLGLLVLLALAAFRVPVRRAAVATLVLVSLYGLSDEIHQAFVPGRSATISDWIADSLGGLAAAAIPWWLSRKSPQH